MFDSNERLKQARTDRGFENPTDAARAFGWNVNTYRSHENGNREISKSAALRYAKAYNVSVDWLLTGSKKSGTNKEHSISTKTGINQIPIRYVPLLELGQVYMGITNDGFSEVDQKFIGISGLSKLNEDVIAVEIPDNSMVENPFVKGVSFTAGDVAVIDKKAKIVPGDYILALVPSLEEAVIRKYKAIKVDNDGFAHIELVPLNSDYPTIPVEGYLEEIVVGKIVQRISNI